jgi:hypothetical protein
MKPDIILIDGHAFSWRRICELRSQQLEAWRRSRPQQPVLFEMKEDWKPESQCSASGRYCEPSLLEWLTLE